MTIPKKPTRQRTSSPKQPVPAPKPAPKPAPAAKAMGRPERGGPSEDAIAESILRLVAARGPGKTVCPSEVARELGGPHPENWSPLMQPVRRVAVRMTKAGAVAILRKGKAVADRMTFGDLPARAGRHRAGRDLRRRKPGVGVSGQPIGDEADPLLGHQVEGHQSVRREGVEAPGVTPPPVR